MAEQTQHSLLDDPLISTKTASGDTRQMSLPQILAGLERDQVVGFAALQPHQWQPWFSFLVQLAAMAVAREGDGQRPDSAEEWRELLVGLADGSEEAWCLVVDDVSKPAFMQSPVPEGSLEEAGYKADIPTPDQLDILITTKNHEIKRQRIQHPAIEHWIYALVTLQTLEGYSAPRNYGIARMNSGSAARPFVGFAVELNWSKHYQHDVEVLLNARTQTVTDYEYDGNGVALLWIKPWDGEEESSVTLAELDPYFIEIARRIRFTGTCSLQCRRGLSSDYRVRKPDSLNGITGDPWTPIDKSGKSPKAMNMSQSGFPYQRVRSLLFGEEFEQPPSLDLRNEEAGFFVGIGLTRGQSKTFGFHRRIVPIPEKVAAWLADDQSRERLSRLSKQRLEKAGDVQTEVLRPALEHIFFGDEAHSQNYKKKHLKTRRWKDGFGAVVDDAFFPQLWQAIELDEDEADARWQQFLYEKAREQLEDAIDAAPIAAARRYRVIANAESIFFARAHKELKYAMNTNSTEEQTDDATE